MNCLGGRTRLGSLPGRLLEPTWRPRGSRRRPGANLAPKLVPTWNPEASVLKLFWTPWGSIFVNFALRSFRPRVCVGGWRLRLDVCLLSLSGLCSPLGGRFWGACPCEIKQNHPRRVITNDILEGPESSYPPILFSLISVYGCILPRTLFPGSDTPPWSRQRPC
mgnify:CR=1 FL=1